MKISNILCPVDFSKPSEAAIAHASAIAQHHDAKLHFVYVYEPILASGDVMSMPMQPAPADLENVRERLEAVRPCEGREIACHHELIFGFPGGSIVGYAATNNIDLIVMGTHGRTGPSRLLMGSVAEAVVRSAGCPVLTVHEGNDSITASS